ncbi:serine acetyltransferase [Mucilaginibacter sp.]|jgi:putative colanic acid biosynthesis acetyltransferase WcaB|uniref:serine acetyltransferase n=1 Tax=Mucilaginibacter sp. TaxID=1882438 RepID=UPI0035643F34
MVTEYIPSLAKFYLNSYNNFTINNMSYIFQDWKRNNNNTKGKIITSLFRLAHTISSKKYLKYILFPYLLFYRFFVEWLLGIELPWHTKVGSGLIVYHGQSIVVNKNSIIGYNCTMRQCLTIGNAKKNGKSPTIGNNVEIGANVCIIGDITIGDYVTIGAGSVVVKNIPPHSIVVGNPARVINTMS